MKTITAYWKDKEDGNIDYASDLAALKHQAQGVILNKAGAVSELERKQANFLGECRGAPGAFQSLLSYKAEIAQAKKDHADAVTHYTEIFGTALPVEAEPAAEAQTES
jgi:hypothetical protein